MRSLGEFFGHIVRAAGTDVSRPPSAAPPGTRTPSSSDAAARRVHSRQETHESTVQGEDGKMILRRTIIEEVEIQPGAGVPPRPPSNK